MPLKRIVSTLLLCFFIYPSLAQHLLSKVVSIEADKQTIKQLLDQISEQGQFKFSYKSDIVFGERLVSLSAHNRTVQQLLDELFEGTLHYTERRNYIILHTGAAKQFTVSGYVLNSKTGAYVSNASVYESQLLLATLTDEKGYFKLPLKNRKRVKTLALTIKKERFAELSVAVTAGYDQELKLPIQPSNEIILNDVEIKNKQEEAHWANQFLLSSRQKIQNLNIGGFFAKRPFQTSILPGMGTHGLLGAQVVNHFSLNILGGYTAGVNGVEIASLFNINKGKVQYFQAAGIFNNVYGSMNGFEAAGIYNFTYGTAVGVQCSGIGNLVKQQFVGVQLAGMANLVTDTVKGVQVAGLVNYDGAAMQGVQISGLVNSNKAYTQGVQLAGIANWNAAGTTGIQVAGIWNSSSSSMNGIQLSGFVNKAHRFRGLQLGIINIADTMDGVGIGIINYYKNGIHQLLIGSNELQQLNIGFLSGSKQFYNLVAFGANIDLNRQKYSVTYGFGKEVKLCKGFAINPELQGMAFYLGNWHTVPLLARGQITLSYKLMKKMSLYAGASFSITERKEITTANKYQDWLAQGNIQYSAWHNNELAHWLGWQLGFKFF